MAFDSKKTILLEKTYLYVRASLGFQLEGTSTEKIPTNNGFYRFFVDNLQKAIGNSYVNILYDSQDLTLQCFCSELYMDELMSSDSSAIEDVVAELKKNTTTIIEFETGVSSAFQSNHEDNVALNAKLNEFETGVSSALAANHEDNVLLHADNESINVNLSSLLSVLDSKVSFNSYNQYYTVNDANGTYKPGRSFLLSYHDFVYEPLFDAYIYRFNECVYQKYSSDKFRLNFRLKYLYGKESINSSLRCFNCFTFYRPSEGRYLTSENNTGSGTMGELSLSPMYNSSDILVHVDIVIQIRKEAYDYMVFCDNSFSDRYSFSENSVIRGSSYMDSIYLDVEPNLNSCIFSHKLDITKKFNSVQDYELCVFAPTSLSTTYLNSMSYIYVVVNGQQKTFTTRFTKTGSSSFPSFYITFSGEDFYHITSISFESVF